MIEDVDFVAGDYEPLQLATSFGPGDARCLTSRAHARGNSGKLDNWAIRSTPSASLKALTAAGMSFRLITE
jgi:hypothetical protein